MFHSSILAVIIALFFVYCLILALRGAWSCCPYPDDEVITTTTTTTECEDSVVPLVAGNLRRQFTEGEDPQSYVIDPVDKKKIFVNDNDDMYEDAAGKVWRLV